MARRGNGEGTIYKRNDGTWCGMVTAGRDPKTGKVKRIAYYGQTRLEVAEKIVKAQGEINSGVFVEPSKIKLSHWIDTWLKEYMKPSLRPTTYSNYEQLIETHIKPDLGETTLKDLRPEQLQRFYNQKFNNGRLDGKGGLSARSVQYMHILIHQCLQQAIKNQLIVRNVSEATTLPRQAKKDIRVLTVEEQLKFLEVAENDNWSTAFKLDLASGLRLGEVLALKWEDVDFKEGLIRVRRSLSRVRIECLENWTKRADVKQQLFFRSQKPKVGLEMCLFHLLSWKN